MVHSVWGAGRARLVWPLLIVLVAVWAAGCSAARIATAPSPRTASAIQRLNDELRQGGTAPWRAHFIDVGQGLAVLHEFPCGAVLFDTGGEQDGKFDSDVALIHYLEQFFARRSDLNGTLDLLLLTHPHIDHTRGVREVLQHFAVRNLADNGQGYGSGADGQKLLEQWARDHGGVHYRAVALADIPSATGLTDAVLDPLQCQPVDPQLVALWGRLDSDPGWSGVRFGKTPFQNNNNHSLVMRVSFGRASGLFTGDLEEPAIRALLQRWGPSGLLDVDLYQVGHHGSINGTLPELCAAMSPSVAVFSMGPPHWQIPWSAWKYGHPRQEIVAMLSAAMSARRKPIDVQLGVKSEQFVPAQIDRALYGTGWEGTVVVEMQADGQRRRVLTTGR